MLEDVAANGALDRFGAHWLAPAVALLERGRIDGLQIVGDGHGSAVTWRASRPSLFARFASRFRQRAFEIPAPLDE